MICKHKQLALFGCSPPIIIISASRDSDLCGLDGSKEGTYLEIHALSTVSAVPVAARRVASLVAAAVSPARHAIRLVGAALLLLAALHAVPAIEETALAVALLVAVAVRVPSVAGHVHLQRLAARPRPRTVGALAIVEAARRQVALGVAPPVADLGRAAEPVALHQLQVVALRHLGRRWGHDPVALQASGPGMRNSALKNRCRTR